MKTQVEYKEVDLEKIGTELGAIADTLMILGIYIGECMEGYEKRTANISFFRLIYRRH